MAFLLQKDPEYYVSELEANLEIPNEGNSMCLTFTASVLFSIYNSFFICFHFLNIFGFVVKCMILRLILVYHSLKQ